MKVKERIRYIIFKQILIRIYNFITLKMIYPRTYRKYAKRPVKKGKVILLEPRFPETTDSLLRIKAELERRGGFEIKEMSLGLEMLRIKQQYRKIMAFLKEFADAEFVFTTDSNKTVGGFDKRPETKVVQVWHACGAFKRFGFSTAKQEFGQSKFKQNLYPLHHNYDIVTVSSPEVVWAYEEAMGLEGQGIVQPLGVSRTDAFFDEAVISSAREKLLSVCPQAAGRKVILYAPTFRGRVLQAESPDEMDLPEMMQQLGDDYVILMKHHPFVKERPVIDERCSQFAFDVTDEMEIEELLCTADICISDYSSLIFEYSLFQKPMIFFAYDLDEYFDHRGFYYDYDEMTPGPIVKDPHELIRAIKEIDADFDPAEVAAFREKFMSACDGNATARIIDTICS